MPREKQVPNPETERLYRLKQSLEAKVDSVTDEEISQFEAENPHLLGDSPIWDEHNQKFKPQLYPNLPKKEKQWIVALNNSTPEESAAYKELQNPYPGLLLPLRFKALEWYVKRPKTENENE